MIRFLGKEMQMILLARRDGMQKCERRSGGAPRKHRSKTVELLSHVRAVWVSCLKLCPIKMIKEVLLSCVLFIIYEKLYHLLIFLQFMIYTLGF